MFVILLCYSLALVGSLAIIMYHINLFKYPIYYSISLTLAIYLPISVTILLPLDYITHNSSSTTKFALSDRTILRMWKGTYWSTFILTWLILPILQEYCRAGNHSRLKKLQESFRKNLRFQAATLLCSLACGIYLILEVGLSFKNLKSMIIGLSHVYALILALWLMAHGMIVIPKNRWVEGSTEEDLNHSLLKFPRLIDIMDDVKSDLNDDIAQVISLKNIYADPSVSGEFFYRDWILRLFEQIPSEFYEIPNQTFSHRNLREISRQDITEMTMSKLTCTFQANLHRYRAYSAERDVLFQRIIDQQRLVDAKNTLDWDERSRILRSENSLLSAKLRYYIRCFVYPLAARSQSMVMFLLSFAIIESEFFHSTNLSLVNMIAFKMGIFQSDWSQAVCLSLFFMYMLCCSINSLAKLKVFNMYHLVPRDSDPVSACFYASYIARMTIPLSYNFLALFTSRASIFEEWYGQSIHLTGLFNLLNDWIPRLLLIPIVLTTFGLYDKIKSKMGLSFDSNYWADFDGTEFDDTSQSSLMSNTRDNQLLLEAKRLVAMESSRRESHNIFLKRASGATISVLSNHRASHSVISARENRQGRYMDHTDDNSVSTQIGSERQTAVWSRLGDVLTDVQNSVRAKFVRGPQHGNPSIPYHDNDSENEYEERLVI